MAAMREMLGSCIRPSGSAGPKLSRVEFPPLFRQKLEAKTGGLTMPGLARRFVVVLIGRFLPVLVAIFAWPLPVLAQINMDSGKSAAQIFASSCHACHRSPREIKPTNAAFLREHYSAGRNEAAAMAAYLASIGSDANAIKQRPRPALGAGQPQPAPAEHVAAPAGDKNAQPEVAKTRRPAESIEVGKLADPTLTQTAAVSGGAAPASPPAPPLEKFEE
jgi:hypothetical protein